MDVKTVKNELFGYKAQERRQSLYEEIFKLPNINLNSVIWNHSVTYRGSLCLAVPMCDQDDIITLTRHVRSFSDTLNILKNTFNDSSTEGTFFNCVRILNTASILNSLDKYLMRNLQTRFCFEILAKSKLIFTVYSLLTRGGIWSAKMNLHCKYIVNKQMSNQQLFSR